MFFVGEMSWTDIDFSLFCFLTFELFFFLFFLLALHLCERGIYKRDRGEFEPMPIEPGKPDEVTFEIMVVSEKFAHVAAQSRIQMVYESIVNTLYQEVDAVRTGISIPPRKKTEAEILLLKQDQEETGNRRRNSSIDSTSGLGGLGGGRGRSRERNSKKKRGSILSHSSPSSVSPSRDATGTPKTKEQLRVEKLERTRKTIPYSKRKHVSTIGYHVTNELPQYKFITQPHPIEFTLIAKTPSQWDPKRYDPSLSERFGQGK